MTQQEDPTQSVFAQLDRVSAEMHALLIGALDRMAGDPQIQRVRQVARERLALGPGDRLLDVGCGAGEEARRLAALVVPDGEVVAVDASATTVAVAAERHDGGPVRYAVGDIMSLDYPNGSFDGVRTERVLQHVADPDMAVAELARVTRTGGRVCLIDTDWESAATDGLPDDLVSTLMTTLNSSGRMHHPTMGRTLRRRLVQAGLSDVTCEPVPLYYLTPEAASSVLPLFNPEIPRDTGFLPEELWDPWFSAVAAAAARGEFLVVLTIWVASGLKA